MNAPKFARRLEHAAEALQILSLYPNGMLIDELAETLEVSDYQLRGTLDSYSRGQSLDSDPAFIGGAPVAFLDDEYPDLDGEELEDWLDKHCVEAEAATWVRLGTGGDDTDPFGVMLGVQEIMELLNCADSLFATEPGNENLRDAIAALRLRWFPESALSSQFMSRSTALPVLRQALAETRRVRFTYSREWQPGVAAREVEPYALRRTYLGFELDAGPVQDNGRIRTFLLRNIWDLELLDDTFERPADVDALVAANRDTRKVTVVVPKSSKRTYEGLVQDLRVTSEDEQPDGYRKLELELQQPFAQRMAMFLFRAGPDAFVVSPPDLEDAAAEQARQLLAHHGLA